MDTNYDVGEFVKFAFNGDYKVGEVISYDIESETYSIEDESGSIYFVGDVWIKPCLKVGDAVSLKVDPSSVGKIKHIDGKFDGRLYKVSFDDEYEDWFCDNDLNFENHEIKQIEKEKYVEKLYNYEVKTTIGTIQVNCNRHIAIDGDWFVFEKDGRAVLRINTGVTKIIWIREIQ